MEHCPQGIRITEELDMIQKLVVRINEIPPVKLGGDVTGSRSVLVFTCGYQTGQEYIRIKSG